MLGINLIWLALIFEEFTFFFEPSICVRGIFRIDNIILTCVFLFLQFPLDILTMLHQVFALSLLISAVCAQNTQVRIDFHLYDIGNREVKDNTFVIPKSVLLVKDFNAVHLVRCYFVDAFNS